MIQEKSYVYSEIVSSSRALCLIGRGCEMPIMVRAVTGLRLVLVLVLLFWGKKGGWRVRLGIWALSVQGQGGLALFFIFWA